MIPHLLHPGEHNAAYTVQGYGGAYSHGTENAHDTMTITPKPPHKMNSGMTRKC